jgi:NADPH-dependent F420 reductase
VNEEAAARAEVVFVAVPYSAQRSTIEPLAGHLAGKVVVGVTVPVRFGKGGASIQPVPDGSAALEIEALLPDSRVVAAFQTISAHDLLDPNRTVDSDVVVCSNDEGARAKIMELSGRIAGIRAVDGGGLANAVHVEGMTALILNLNRRYKARAAFRITGI